MNAPTLRAGGRPTRPPFWPIAVLLLGCLAAPFGLAGCDTARATQTPPTPTTSPIPTSSAPAPAAELSLAAAWGNVPIVRLPTDMGDNRFFVFENAVTPDGQWLVGVVEPRDFLTNTTRLSYLALYNVHTRQINRIRALLHPQSQVLGASIDDHWLAWSEAPDQPTFYDWTMFLYNRDTMQVTELARAPRGPDGRAAPGPTTPPVVSGGHVLWSQPLAPITQGDDASLNNIVVRLEDLATGQVTTLATRAGQSTLAWPWAAWGQITTGGGGYMTLKNLVTGQERHLPRQPATLALSGTSVAYDDTTAVYLIDDVTAGTDPTTAGPGVEIARAANEAEHLEFVTLNDRLVAWRQQVPQPPVWDRAQHRIVRLPTTNGESESWVGGHTLIWFEPEPQAQTQQDERNGLNPLVTMNVIDTTSLPPAPPQG